MASSAGAAGPAPRTGGGAAPLAGAGTSSVAGGREPAAGTAAGPSQRSRGCAPSAGAGGDRAPVEHVALLLLAPYASGAEHQTLALCRYLRARCRVTLLTNDEFAHLLQTDRFFTQYTRDLEVVRLGRAFPAAPARTPAGALERAALYPRLQVEAYRVLRRLRPDVVHLVLAPSFFAYAPLFRAVRVPTVLTLSGEMRYVRRYYGPAKRAVVRHAVARAGALVVCSADELANLRLACPGAERRARLLDNFTDVRRFRPVDPKERRVVFAARLHPEKGALLFVDAVARARPLLGHQGVGFALLGRGDLERQVAERIAALGLHDTIQRGFTTDLAPVLARSSLFISCQQHENLGSSSLLEAMACANAVVATDVGQTWRMVDEAVGARVAPEAGALAEAMCALLADPARLAACGAAARRRVLERYSPGPYLDRLLQVYALARERAGT